MEVTNQTNAIVAAGSASASDPPIIDAESMDELIARRNPRDAWRALKEYKKGRGGSTALQEKDKDTLAMLYFLSLSYVSQDDVVLFFQKLLAPVLRNETVNDEFLRDEFKLMLIANMGEDELALRYVIGAALMANEEILTKEEMVLPNGTKRMGGRIGDWINDFLFFLRQATGTKRSLALDMVEFTRSSRNGKVISEEERAAVQKLLNLYEYVAQPGSFQTGFPEDFVIRTKQGRTVILSDGKVIPISEPREEKESEAESGDHLERLARTWADWTAGDFFRQLEKERRKHSEIHADKMQDR